jgi:hypothetical protein
MTAIFVLTELDLLYFEWKFCLLRFPRMFFTPLNNKLYVLFKVQEASKQFDIRFSLQWELSADMWQGSRYNINCRIKPVVNQVELHPMLGQKRLVDRCFSMVSPQTLIAACTLLMVAEAPELAAFFYTPYLVLKFDLNTYALVRTHTHTQSHNHTITQSHTCTHTHRVYSAWPLAPSVAPMRMCPTTCCPTPTSLK